MDWRKFLTTEWIAFLIIFSFGTHMVYRRILSPEQWVVLSLGLCINLLTVRWHKKRVLLEHPEKLPGIGEDT